MIRAPSLAASIALGAASGVTGFLAWGEDHLAIAPVMVLFWALTRSRVSACLVAFSYYLAATRALPEAADVFFATQTSLLLGAGLWLAVAATLSLPWALLHGASHKPVRAIAAVCLVAVPPVGWVGWCSPFLQAAAVVPGYGIASIAIGLLLIAGLASASSERRKRTQWLGFGICAIVIGAAFVPPQPVQQVHGWLGMKTNAGKGPETFGEQFVRNGEVTIDVLFALKQGAKVIVFPEQHVGLWTNASRVFLESSLGPALRRHEATLVIGAAVSTGDRRRSTNSAMIFDGNDWVRHDARMAVPVSMIKPWADDSTVITMFGPGVQVIDGRRALISICYEDMLIWPTLQSLIVERPEVIVSIANAWWVSGSGAGELQEQHILTWARVFNLPLVRAVNRE